MCVAVTPSGPVPTTIRVLVSSPTLGSGEANSGKGSGVTVTATVKDAANNLMQGQIVSFSATSGALVGGPSVTTDASGASSVMLFTDGDPSERTITVTATVGTISGQVAVNVTGNTLKLSGPANGQQGMAASYLLSLLDSKAAGISGQAVTLTATNGALSPSTVTTDAKGQAQFTFTPSGGAATISAAGFGLTAAPLSVEVSSDALAFTAPVSKADGSNPEFAIDKPNSVALKWFRSGSAVPDGTQIKLSLTRGQFSNGTKAITVTTTAGLTGDIPVSSTEAGITAVSAVGQLTGNPATSQQFEFVATTVSAVDVKASPSTIAPTKTSQINASVRDAASNPVKGATVSFGASGTTSGTVSPTSALTDSSGNATTVYTATNNTSAQDGITISATAVGTDAAATTKTSTTKMTVSGSAVRIAIGTGNTILVLDENRYQLPYTVTVSDAAGNPQQGVTVSLTLRVTKYRKGGTIGSFKFECANEDSNFNGLLDPGEDVNDDGDLDPNSTAVVDATVTLGTDGSGKFNVTYTKDEAFWTIAVLTAKASVNGTDGVASQLISPLPLAQGDAGNPPNLGKSKWGENDCPFTD